MKTNIYNTAVKDFSDGLYRFVLKNIRHQEDARDIVQETFTKLWEHRKNVDEKKIKSWLFTTAYHMLINLSKQKGRWKMEETDKIETTTENQFELKEVLNKTINSLPEQQKSIILLRDLEGYNYDEIGEILKLSKSQVKVYLFRARKKVKEQIVALNLA